LYLFAIKNFSQQKILSGQQKTLSCQRKHLSVNEKHFLVKEKFGLVSGKVFSLLAVFVFRKVIFGNHFPNFLVFVCY